MNKFKIGDIILGKGRNYKYYYSNDYAFTGKGSICKVIDIPKKSNDDSLIVSPVISKPKYVLPFSETYLVRSQDFENLGKAGKVLYG